MMNNNHKNSGCGFGEQLVSYLYDETSAAETAAFETHLENCAVCADELAAFSGVQFSIGDWKAKDFALLKTPVIEIPYEKPPASPATIVNVKEPWFSAWRKLFSLSPAWSLAGASAAVLAICVGVALFALNSGDGDDLADKTNNSKVAASPTVEKPVEAANMNDNRRSLPEKETAPVEAEKSVQPELAATKSAETKNKSSVKPANNQPKPAKAEINAPKTNNARREIKNKTDVPPKILVEEDEDDSLRLAEIFEEIDTIE